jgi:hypothetical protein
MKVVTASEPKGRSLLAGNPGRAHAKIASKQAPTAEPDNPTLFPPVSTDVHPWLNPVA